MKATQVSATVTNRIGNTKIVAATITEPKGYADFGKYVREHSKPTDTVTYNR